MLRIDTLGDGSDVDAVKIEPVDVGEELRKVPGRCKRRNGDCVRVGALPSSFSWIPQTCLPNNIVAIREGYVMKIDSATGKVQDAQWIDGSAPGVTGIALPNLAAESAQCEDALFE